MFRRRPGAPCRGRPARLIRTGSCACRASCAAMHVERPAPSDLRDGFELTAYFLGRDVFAPRGLRSARCASGLSGGTGENTADETMILVLTSSLGAIAAHDCAADAITLVEGQFLDTCTRQLLAIFGAAFFRATPSPVAGAPDHGDGENCQTRHESEDHNEFCHAFAYASHVQLGAPAPPWLDRRQRTTAPLTLRRIASLRKAPAPSRSSAGLQHSCEFPCTGELPQFGAVSFAATQMIL